MSLNQRKVGVWDADCRRSYRARVDSSLILLRDEVMAQANAKDRKAVIHDWDARQQDRLDRLYMNTTLTEAEYTRHSCYLMKMATELELKMT